MSDLISSSTISAKSPGKLWFHSPSQSILIHQLLNLGLKNCFKGPFRMYYVQMYEINRILPLFLLLVLLCHFSHYNPWLHLFVFSVQSSVVSLLPTTAHSNSPPLVSITIVSWRCFSMQPSVCPYLCTYSTVGWTFIFHQLVIYLYFYYFFLFFAFFLLYVKLLFYISFCLLCSFRFLHYLALLWHFFTQPLVFDISSYNH